MPRCQAAHVAAVHPAATPEPLTDEKPPEAPLAMRLRWIQEVATMGPDELADFEERTFRQWDRASLSALRIVIDRRRKELDR